MPDLKMYSRVLLAALTLLEVNAQTCRPGWFGAGCKFKCHCANSKLCRREGECLSNHTCADGYFGPACQYVDMAHRYAHPSSPSYLHDSNEATCNPDTRATSVTLTLTESVPASWFRIAVKDDRTMLMFTLTIDDYYPCPYEKRYIVSTSLVDVICQQGVMIRDLIIKGDIVASICSIYISGGRNMALEQYVNQSSTYDTLSKAANAVDGDTANDSASGSCARTNSGLQQTFTVYFDRPMRLLRALLYNSDALTLHGFTVRTYDQNGSVLVTYIDPHRQPQPMYDVNLISTETVAKLEVTATNSLPPGPNGLHFCEIEVFGDYQCPTRQYGLECADPCTCSSTDGCSQINGACTPICPPGRYGHKCALHCSSSCLEDKCEPQSGVCYYCRHGNIGDYCASASSLNTEVRSSHMWSYVPIFMVMMATPVVVYVCLDKKTSSQQTPESLTT